MESIHSWTLTHPIAAKSLFFVPGLQEITGIIDVICVPKDPGIPVQPNGHTYGTCKVLAYETHLIQGWCGHSGIMLEIHVISDFT